MKRKPVERNEFVFVIYLHYYDLEYLKLIGRSVHGGGGSRSRYNKSALELRLSTQRYHIAKSEWECFDGVCTPIRSASKSNRRVAHRPSIITIIGHKQNCYRSLSTDSANGATVYCAYVNRALSLSTLLNQNYKRHTQTQRRPPSPGVE